MTKSAQYYREYRAKKKIELLQKQMQPLFSVVQSQPVQPEEKTQPQAQPEVQPEEKTQPEVIKKVVETLVQRELEGLILADIIEFPGVAQPAQPAQPEEKTQPAQPEVQLEEKTQPEPKKIDVKLITTIAGIVLFLIFNTVFLAREQVTLYQSLGYSLPWAVLIAVLSETALVSFSALSSATKEWRWKIPLCLASVLTGAIILGVLGASVDKNEEAQTQKSEQFLSIKNRINSIEALKTSAIADLSQLDAETHPTARKKLRAKIEAWDLKIEEISNKLAAQTTINTDSNSTILKLQRALMMLWSFLMAGYLGHVLGKKNS